MSRHLRLASFAILLVALSAPAARGEDPVPAQGIVDQLLRLPAPAPPGGPQTRPSFPDDNAPVDALVDFWAAGGFYYGPSAVHMPSATVRGKLLEGGLKDPIYLPQLLDYLPESPETAAAVKRLYDTLASSPDTTQDWKEWVHGWLLTHSRYFRNELIQIARGIESKPNPWVNKAAALRALANADWAAAYPVLLQDERSDQPAVASLAKVIRFEHAVKEKDTAARDAVGARLQQIALDTRQPYDARRLAVDALFEARWPGCDAIFRGLVPEAAVWPDMDWRALFKSRFEVNPPPIPDDAIAANPDHYLPMLKKMLADPDPKIRRGAAGMLMLFPRAEVLRLILPVAAEDKNMDAAHANALLHRLENVDLPESAAVLNQMLVAGHADASLLATVMVRQKCPSAVDALRAALAGKHGDEVNLFPHGVDSLFNDPGYRDIVRMFVDHGGLFAGEIAAAIEAYALCHPQPGEYGNASGLFGRRLTPLENRGVGLATAAAGTTGVADLLLGRADALRAGQTQVAAKIWELLATWEDPAIDRRLLARLRDEPIDFVLAQLALGRDASMRKHQAAGLRKLLDAGGLRAGLAGAILGDGDLYLPILKGTDVEAIRMLLACGRLLRTPLQIAAVKQLFDRKDPAIAEAAERFLMVDDSAEARRIVLARHPGEALILGADWERFVDDDLKDRTGERALRGVLLQPEGPDEIFDLYGIQMEWGGGSASVFVYHDHTMLDLEPVSGKHLLRKVTDDELRTLRQFVSTYHVDDLPPIDMPVIDGSFYQYTHVSRAGGRRVHMHSPGDILTSNTVHFHLIKLFERMVHRGTYQTHYELQDAIRDARVLWTAGTARHIRAVWKRGGDFRVLVGSDEDGTWTNITPFNGGWQAFRDGKLAGPVAEPPGFVFPINDNHAAPQVIPDGRWTIESEDGRYRVKAASGKIFPLPAGREYSGLGILPHWEKLLIQSRRPYPATNDFKYFLLDLATGKTQPVEGDFKPLIDNEARPMQSSGNPEEFWIARKDPTSTWDRPDQEYLHTHADQDQTLLELYSVREFRVVRELKIPGLLVNNDALMIDNAEGVAYIAANGDLLRIPLPRAIGK